MKPMLTIPENHHFTHHGFQLQGAGPDQSQGPDTLGSFGKFSEPPGHLHHHYSGHHLNFGATSALDSIPSGGGHQRGISFTEHQGGVYD